MNRNWFLLLSINLSLTLSLTCLNTYGYSENTNFDLLQSTVNLVKTENNTPQENNESLLEKLFLLTKEGHKVLGYGKARHLVMGHIYLQNSKGQYSVKDVYCQKEYTNEDFHGGSGVGPDLVPDNKVINIEHTWPQSRFTGLFNKESQKSDLHHLYPADSKMNSARASYKFAEINNSKEALKCPESSLGYVNSALRFEPPTVHKGHVARALFYFSVRYKIHIDADEEAYLRKWNASEPVDQEEKQHHDLIAKFQGNRNPFIDNPELVNQISDF